MGSHRNVGAADNLDDDREDMEGIEVLGGITERDGVVGGVEVEGLESGALKPPSGKSVLRVLAADGVSKAGGDVENPDDCIKIARGI